MDLFALMIRAFCIMKKDWLHSWMGLNVVYVQQVVMEHQQMNILGTCCSSCSLVKSDRISSFGHKKWSIRCIHLALLVIIYTPVKVDFP
mmetsp:Transcript_20297/g.29435  ORF Transcript_20297/g.29435 Transcript_20297/m.29435 type:complete len:89 (+) Transcript_20297:924-1190(+)